MIADKENEESFSKVNKYHSDLLVLEPDLDKEIKFKFKKRYAIVIIMTFLLFGLSLTLVGVQQSEMINLYLDGKNSTIQEYADVCNILDFSNINLIAHPFSFLLLLIYMFLFWRRSCCLKCLFARPAPPMIVHPFKKNNRFFTAAVYGAISFEVFQIVYTAITKSSASDIYSKLVYDPSGLFKLTLRIIEVFLAALRYYPPLIAFCADSIFIYITAALYMMVDIGNNIYTEGRCTGFDEDSDFESLSLLKESQVVFAVIKNIPQFFILSLLYSELTTRSVLKIIDMFKNKYNRLLINEDLKFYSIHDLKYCLNLYNNKDTDKKKNFFKRFIYDWNPNFKFSSRIINAHVVALLALFYFFVDSMFYGIIFLKKIIMKSDGSITDLLDVFGDLNIQINFEKNLLVVDDHVAGFVVAAVVSYLVCLVQVFLGLKGIQSNIIRLYKGQKTNIALLESNASVSNGNTHFAGFLVGFLLNGYLFIFFFLFLIIIIIYYLTQFSTWNEISPILLKLVPIITIFVVKFIFNFICSRFIFLQQRAKVLALDNFRAYSVFVYVTFFFDCFVGAINAMVRLIIGFLGSLFFMPRVGYSFLGRQIERFDAGFRVSTGYYQMEYTHSHPVLVSFCALLFYKRFLERIDQHYSNDIFYTIKNRRKTKKNQINDLNPNQEINDEQIDFNDNLVKSNGSKCLNDKPKPIRNKRIINKWLLIVTLINNNSLIFERKKEFSYRKFILLNINDLTKVNEK